jgi:FK506-binding protein 4/5
MVSLGTFSIKDVPRRMNTAEQVPEGLDLAIQKMKEGERDLITVRPAYGFGDKAHAAPLATVAPGSTLTYDVVLTSFVNVGNRE